MTHFTFHGQIYWEAKNKIFQIVLWLLLYRRAKKGPQIFSSTVDEKAKSIKHTLQTKHSMQWLLLVFVVVAAAPLFEQEGGWVEINWMALKELLLVVEKKTHYCFHFIASSSSSPALLYRIFQSQFHRLADRPTGWDAKVNFFYRSSASSSRRFPKVLPNNTSPKTCPQTFNSMLWVVALPGRHQMNEWWR